MQIFLLSISHPSRPEPKAPILTNSLTLIKTSNWDNNNARISHERLRRNISATLLPPLRAPLLSCPSPGRLVRPSSGHHPSFHPCCNSRSPPCQRHGRPVGRGRLKILRSSADLSLRCQGLQLITDEMDLIWTLTAGQTPARARRRRRRRWRRRRSG